MRVNKLTLASYYEKSLFYIYIPINFILMLLAVTNRTFFINSYSLIALFITGYFLLFARKIKLDANYLYVFFFILYCFILSTINYLNGDVVDMRGRSLAKYHYTLYILYFTSYLYGRTIKFEINIVTKVLFGMVLLSIIAILDTNSFSLDFSIIDSEKKGIYLILSDIFTIFILFLISNIKRNNNKIILFIIGCIFLFILNSRSSLYAFIIVFVLYQAFYSNIQARTTNIIILLIVSMGFLSSSYFSLLLESNPRMLAIVTGIDSDGSTLARENFFHIGISRTLKTPILGDYGGVIEESSSLGAYIHNILSYWQSYGFLPFIMSLFFFIINPILIAYKSYTERKKFNSSIYFLISIYLVLLLIVSKAYTWYFAWFLMGYLQTYPKLKIRQAT